MAWLRLLAILLALAVPAVAGEAPGPMIPGVGNPASECFVTLRDLKATDENRVVCVDGDSSCDVDGDIDGVCTFYARVCVAETLPGCQATAITSVKAQPKKLGLSLPRVPATEPTCGDRGVIRVPLKKGGTKAGHLRVVLTAKNDGKPKKERDQIQITCEPPPFVGPGPTDTTVTTSTATTTLAPSGTLVSTTSITILPGSDVLENGDFGQPVLSSPQNGWSFSNIADGGWHSAVGQTGGYFTLNGSGDANTDPTLTQQVEVFPGTVYRLTGAYRSFSPTSGDPAKPDAFAVAVAPQPSDHASTVILALPRPSPDALAWTPFSVDFTPSSPSTTVSFIAERGGDDSSFDLDQLTLSPVQ